MAIKLAHSQARWEWAASDMLPRNAEPGLELFVILRII